MDLLVGVGSKAVPSAYGDVILVQRLSVHRQQHDAPALAGDA